MAKRTARRAVLVPVLFVAFCASCSLFVSLDDLSSGTPGASDAGNDVAVDALPDVGATETGAIDSGFDAAPKTAPTFVAYVTQSNAGSQTLITVTRPPQIGAGDLMVAIVYQYIYGTTSTPPDGSWTKFMTYDDPGPSYEVHYYEKIAGASEPATYAFGVSTSAYASVTLVGYAGASSVSPVAATATSTFQKTGNYVAPPLVTSVPSTLTVVSAVADGQPSANWTPKSAVSTRITNGYVFLADAPASALGDGDGGAGGVTCSVSDSNGGIGLFAVAPL